VRDLLELTAELVATPSVTGQEGPLADRVEEELSGAPWLEVVRVDDNVVARSTAGRRERLVLAGHLDTVPGEAVVRERTEDRVGGLGAADMKGGLAVLLALATTEGPTLVDATYVFYAREEGPRARNGLLALEKERPDLLVGDAAVLAEPTGTVVEAGCQGSLRVAITLTGRRAHAARPWRGVNALHRLAPVLARLAAYEPRRVVIDGCEFVESLQAVRVSGGVAGNVVPDRVELLVNHRFAPDRDAVAAFEEVRRLVAPALEEGRDVVTLEDAAPPAPPALDHPLLAALVRGTGRPPRAKLGWTDVAFFAGRGVPACNFGPGDPELAHTEREWVERKELEAAYAALASVLGKAAVGQT
jgi:succinyl-diaminopimelate desuccinylase